MTGFARDSGASGDASWTWEIKSVNGKALDARLRLPAGFDQIEAPARQALIQAFKRGNLQVTLDVQRSGEAQGISINREVLAQYLSLTREIETQHGSPAPRAELLLGLKGVIVTRLEFGNAFLVDVKTDHGPFFAEFNGKRKPDIAQADDRNI